MPKFVRFVLLATAIASVVGLGARAQAREPGGSIVGSMLVSEGDVGGGARVELWGALGALRLGGFFGVAALSSELDWRNRTMMPAGALVALAFDVGLVELVVTARGGMWGGASQEDKLRVGGLVGGGAWVDFAMEGGIGLGIGAELLGLFGGGDTWVVEPGLRLTWGRPTSASEPAPDADAVSDPEFAPSQTGPSQTSSALSRLEASGQAHGRDAARPEGRRAREDGRT